MDHLVTLLTMESQASGIQASKSDWNYADFKVCCDDLTRMF